MFRYGMKTLLATMFAATMLCGAMFALPGWLSALTMMLLAMMVGPALITGVVFARRGAKAFCIGALATAAIPSFIFLPYFLLEYITLYSSAFAETSNSPSLSATLDSLRMMDEGETTPTRLLIASYFLLLFLSGIVGTATRWFVTRGQQPAAIPMPGRLQPAVAPPTSVLHARVTTVQMQHDGGDAG